MFLDSDSVVEMDHLLREIGGKARQRQLQAEVTLATTLGEVVAASIGHLTRTGITLVADSNLIRGTRFGFEVPACGKTYLVFCEVENSQADGVKYLVTASFLAEETVLHQRLHQVPE